jgi:hypothetical protein
MDMKYYAPVIIIAIALMTLIGFDQTRTNEVAEVATTTTSTTEAPPTTTTSTTTTTVPVVVELPKPAAKQPKSTEAFFECVRHRESRGNYQAVNPTGTFMGAYQIYQGGWDTFATRIDRHDLIGVPPHTALPADQDAIALAMYNELGAKPWGGACQ